MKQLCLFIATMLLFLPTSIAAHVVKSDDIVILFDNDVHGRMEGYPKMADLRKEMSKITENVCVISLGDFAQGGPLCSVSHGMFAVDAMNYVGYDYITLGNHEFDYGIDHMQRLTSALHAKTITCNFVDAKTDKPMYEPYTIRQFGNLKVAFIGCVTPVTKISDAPDSFVDAEGNDIYHFCHGTFYSLLQKYVDEVRAMGVDLVILMAHLGDIDSSYETSEIAIKQTHGIDIVLDGHAHHVIEGRHIRNAKGDSVLLVSTGSHFMNIGRIIIGPDGNYKSDLISIPSYKGKDPSVEKLIASFQKAFSNLPVIAKSPYDLAGFDQEHDTYDRNCQTNLGSLCADAFRVMSRTDIGWVNAGGIRGSIAAGNITFKELLNAFPFENKICVSEFTGQQIIDALEYGVSRAPDDNGNYPQVSGLTFDINLDVEPNVQNSANGSFLSIGEGPRRVTNVKVLNTKTDQYEPIDLSKKYTLASIDFILMKGGCNGMLSNGHLLADDQMVDTQLIEDYLRTYLNGIVDDSYRKVKQQQQ